MKWEDGNISLLANEVGEPYYPDGKEDLPYIGLEHVEPQTLKLLEIGSSLDVQSNKQRFKEGDILFGTMRPYFRKVIKPSFDGICSTEFSIIRAKNPKDAAYIFYHVAQSKFIEFATTNSKGDRPRTKWELFSRFPAKIPSSEIRERIGNILSSYDDFIENNFRRIQLLEQSAHHLYREWFVRLRFPGYEHTKISEGVPEGWKKDYVPELIEINPKTRVSIDKDVRYVPMAALSETSMVVSFKEMERREKATGAKFRNGDTLFPRITPCLENGKTAFVNFLNEGEVACGSTEFIVLRGRNVSPEFVYCFARTYDFRENAIKSMIGSSGRQRVQETCFDEFPVLFPSNVIMDQFNDAISSVFKMISVLHLESEKLRQARDLLLPKLMVGEVEVNV